MSAQPDYEFVANLGDASPLIHGGFFVYRDKTGVYPPMAEMVECPSDDCELGSRKARWTVYSFDLDRCTYIDGILSDNECHPELPVWFASPESRKAERPQDTTYLSDLVQSSGTDVDELIADFCSDDPIRLAHAYREVAEYHGWENFDQYPETYTRTEMNARFPEFSID